MSLLKEYTWQGAVLMWFAPSSKFSSPFMHFMVYSPVLDNEDVFQIIWNCLITTFIIVTSVCLFICFLLLFVPSGSSTFYVFSREDLGYENHCLSISFFLQWLDFMRVEFETREGIKKFELTQTRGVFPWKKRTGFSEGLLFSPTPVFCQETPMFLSPLKIGEQRNE